MTWIYNKKEATNKQMKQTTTLILICIACLSLVSSASTNTELTYWTDLGLSIEESNALNSGTADQELIDKSKAYENDSRAEYEAQQEANFEEASGKARSFFFLMIYIVGLVSLIFYLVFKFSGWGSRP